MNPMIRKELFQRMRDRRAWILPSLYLLVLSAVVAFTYFSQVHNAFGLGGGQEVQGAEIGVSIFLAVAFTQMGLLLLLAPIFSAGALTIEKEQRTLPALLTSLLTSAQIWWGKFVASLLFLVLLLLTGLPILSLTLALGGIGLREIFLVTLVTLVVLASISAVSLYCSSFFRRSVHSTAVSYSFLIALSVVTAVVFGFLEDYWREAGGGAEPPWYVSAPLQLNPFSPLIAVLLEPGTDFPAWVSSLAVFAGLGALAVALALRNIERSGDQS